MIYSNFFSPQIISMLFCLHECNIQGEQKDPRNEVVQYLIKKILTITQASSVCLTNQMFQAEMLSITNNINFLERYRECLQKLQTFNDFYKQLSKMLKTLRSLRNNKLEQGNLIDFLIRRMYIYFQKLDFKELIKIYEQFLKYIRGEVVNIPQHEFMLTKSIEEIKFNLENYNPITNPEDLARQVLQLSQYDHTYKTSYLNSLIKSAQNIPIESINSMHRYFDKSLGNLFQQKTEVNLMSNKINHCILSNAFINLRMNYLQECLQSISEGLRISQNNTDEQSINNCIIYLYKISEQLGKYQEQILLNEHAITHSLNLNNILLMVYSCFNYSIFEKKYNCSDPNISLLKNRNINWTDALHFSKKKIFSTFQSNCKNIYHTYRNLLIPTFMTKLSILIHLPELQKLFLNEYYNRKELMQLQIYKQFKQMNDLDVKIQKIHKYYKTNQQKLLYLRLKQLKSSEEKAYSPLQIIKIRKTINKIKYQQSNSIDSFNQCESLIQFCYKYGYIKEESLEQMILTIKILIKNELYHDALVKVQKTYEHSSIQRLKEYQIVCQTLKLQIYIHLQLNIDEVITKLQQIEESSDIFNLRQDFKIIFYETKVLINRKLYELLLLNINLYDQCQILKRNQLQNLEQILQIYIRDNHFVKIKAILAEIYDILLLNPTIVQKAKIEKIKSTLTYLEKTLSIYNTIDYCSFDEQEMMVRIGLKIRKLYEQ